MKCNGKCHLAKGLNKTENNGKNLPNTSNNKTELTLFIEKHKTFEFRELFSFLERMSFSYKENYHFSFTDGVFHPPQLVLI